MRRRRSWTGPQDVERPADAEGGEGRPRLSDHRLVWIASRAHLGDLAEKFAAAIHPETPAMPATQPVAWKSVAQAFLPVWRDRHSCLSPPPLPRVGKPFLPVIWETRWMASSRWDRHSCLSSGRRVGRHSCRPRADPRFSESAAEPETGKNACPTKVSRTAGGETGKNACATTGRNACAARERIQAAPNIDRQECLSHHSDVLGPPPARRDAARRAGGLGGARGVLPAGRIDRHGLADAAQFEERLPAVLLASLVGAAWRRRASFTRRSCGTRWPSLTCSGSAAGRRWPCSSGRCRLRERPPVVKELSQQAFAFAGALRRSGPSSRSPSGAGGSSRSRCCWSASSSTR